MMSLRMLLLVVGVLVIAGVSVAQDWPNMIVDTAGDAGRGTSIAYDSSGLPKIAYRAGDSSLMYAEYTDSELWHSSSTGYSGTDVKLLIDEFDTAHLVFKSTNNRLYYLTKNGDGGWTGYQQIATSVSQFDFVLVYDAEYQIYVPHVSRGSGSALSYYYREPGSGNWIGQTVDSAGSVGNYSSIAVDDQNRVYISYYDATEQDLKFAFYDGQDWGSFVVDGVPDNDNVGQHTSLVLDDSGTPHIVYYDMGLGDLKHATISLSALGN